METGELYNRQQSLDLHPPESVCVVGVGGVGSWTALNLALTGVKKLCLVDPDIVEIHNLNRTPFRTQDVNQPKVTALAELIYERREDVRVLTAVKNVEDLTKVEIEQFQSNILVDCRDMVGSISASLGKQLITGGYDGYNITIHVNPSEKSVWTAEERRGYRITPSWLVPPQVIASVITTYLCCPEIQIKKEKIININIKELIKYDE